MREPNAPTRNFLEDSDDGEALDYLMGQPGESCSIYTQETKLHELGCLNPGGA